MSNEKEKNNPQEPNEVEASLETTPSAEEKAPEEKPKKAVKAKKSEDSDEVAKAAPKKEVAAQTTEDKAAAPKEVAPKKEETPPPPEPGKYGELLQANGFSPTHLGKDAKGTEMVDIKSTELREVSEFLRDNSASKFDLLVYVAGVDWKDRLEVVYYLYSTQSFESLILKATAADEKLPSVTSVWPTADWHERETYDLFGITFEGHPNLKRILMPSDWLGFPLRKDYKVEDPRLVWNER